MEFEKTSDTMERRPSTPDESTSPASHPLTGEPVSSKKSAFSRHLSVSFKRRQRSPGASSTSSTKPDSGSSKGPFGLTEVFHPSSHKEVLAHVVFVHGLGGGSEHTWTKDDVFWPKDLLPLQEPFQRTVIHSFGYDSDFKKSSTLNINDFSKSLLNSMLNHPSLTDSKTPIILVAHSMGGLVAKRACIISKQMSAYSEIAERVRAVVFVATPHTGSNLAGILDRIFRLSSGLKPYLEDLGKNSDVVQSINAEFPSQSLDLLLHSFYETNPLNIGGFREVMIVPKADAVLNYPHEQSALLYGDHRSICKFASPEDHNFIAIWQALASCMKKLQAPPSPKPPSLVSQFNEELNEYFDIWEPPADDIYRVKSDRIPGSCQWLSDSSDYQDWLKRSTSKIYWLRGPPGCGKSYAAGCAIEGLEHMNKRCCYYFVDHGDRVKSSMEGFILSLTWQMASLYPGIQEIVLRKLRKDRGLTKSGDYRALLRKFWEQGILQTPFQQETTYWVIDALDECRLGHELAKFLLRVQERSGGLIKILVTTRNAYSDYQIPTARITSRDIDTEDIQVDISRYLDVHSSQVPGTTLSERESLGRGILEKSNGCFLWAILVLENLGKIVGPQARLRALEEMPPGMDALYTRVVRSMSSKEKEISKTILTWVACSTRPLRTSELKYVVEHLAMDEVDDIETIVSRYCNDLLYVDKNLKVNMRHASARDFLFRQDINSDLDDDLTIRRDDGHKLLAMACLDYLNGPEMKVKPKRKMVAVAQERSVFVSYACQALHEHVNRSSAQDPDILVGLATFLKSNVLSWIEELAKAGNLETILRFAQVLKVFLRRKSRTDLLLGEEVVLLDTWGVDLVKLVSKFGRQLLLHPESILHLIPPFCPPETAPHAQFTRGLGTAVTVTGLTARTWDDCLCTIVLSEPKNVTSGVIRRERMHCVATSEDNFCIGTSLGRIVVLNEKTYLEEMTLDHEQPVTRLQYATSKTLLASASRKMIRVWSTETWEQRWEVPTRQSILDMAFVDDDQMLLVALKSNTILAINLIDRTTESTSWIGILEDPHDTWYRGLPPEQAAFNTDLGILAVGYRHRRILIYNYDQESYQILDHQDSLPDGIDQHPSVTINSMTFSKLSETSLLAAGFSSSDLVLFDTELGTVQARVSSVHFRSLMSSPDGRTLAASRMDGAIELYDFETLHKLWRIRPEDGAIVALDFSADSTRFIVIRAGGRNCRIWDPAALYRRDVGHNSVRSPSLGSGSQDGIYEESDEAVNLVGAIAWDANGQAFFVGKDDGSVSMFDGKTGLSITVLFSHIANIKTLDFGAKGQLRLLVSVDTAGFLMVHTITNNKQSWSAECLFTHRASVTGVQQFLCGKDLARLLVCSNDQATLLSMTTGEELQPPVHCKADTGQPYLWTQHPRDPSLLLYVAGGTAQVYVWESMNQVTSHTVDAQLSPQEELHSDLQVGIHSAISLFTGTDAVLATSYSRTGQGSRSQLTTLCFAASAFTPESNAISSLSECQPVCDVIDTIVGTYRERLVFLHSDGWICSVKAAGLHAGKGHGAGGTVMHHFAPPVDWLRTSRELLIRVSRLGDVLIVVKGEVAVVRRGLERVADV